MMADGLPYSYKRRSTIAAEAAEMATKTEADRLKGMLTKEQATADTMRALKQCYPDRWEEIWNALGKTSESGNAGKKP